MTDDREYLRLLNGLEGIDPSFARAMSSSYSPYNGHPISPGNDMLYPTDWGDMINCAYCGRRNRSDREFCHGCGAPLTPSREPQIGECKVVWNNDEEIRQWEAIWAQQDYVSKLIEKEWEDRRRKQEEEEQRLQAIQHKEAVEGVWVSTAIILVASILLFCHFYLHAALSPFVVLTVAITGLVGLGCLLVDLSKL